ncbi:MAG: hypothetical protein M1812_000358 [Candelaria pacifica]|nr:MAG: hypothetical protein M1812_000358 [Candelaria pacifica]
MERPNAEIDPKGALPTFTETSSKELNDIHASFRNFVFLPSHLLKRQKNTIYKAKYKSMLESEPVYAEVGEEKIKLQHINQLTDKPNVRTSIARMLDLMGEFNEWNNLPAFLVGLHKAKSPLRGPTLERIARRANGAGRQDVVMNCIRMFGKTDFVLKDQAVVREVMLGAHMRAQQGSWEELPTRKALAQAEKVVELLENPAHSGGYKVEKHDPRAQPDIIGVVLELAAVRASSHLGGKDEDGKVLTYAERLWATWGNADLISETWYDANQKLSMWAPTWNGLKMAAKVLEPESSALGNINHSLRDLEQFLLLAKDMVVSNAPKKKSKQRGLEFYDAVSSQ